MIEVVARTSAKTGTSGLEASGSTTSLVTGVLLGLTGCSDLLEPNVVIRTFL